MTAMTYTTTRRIGRAEWTKLRALPSTWRTAVIGVLGGYAAIALTAASLRASRSDLTFAPGA